MEDTAKETGKNTLIQTNTQSSFNSSGWSLFQTEKTEIKQRRLAFFFLL